MKKSQNSAGFGMIEVLLILATISIAAIVVWNVYRSSNATPVPQTKQPVTSTQTTAAPQTNTSTPATATPDTSVRVYSNANGYIEIKEWGVRFKLAPDALASYYVMRQDKQYADFYSGDFEKIKNIDGRQCADIVLFVAERNAVSATNGQSYGKRINGYAYSGETAHQSAPRCAVINDTTTTDVKLDNSILEDFTRYRNALNTSFQSLESL